MSTERLTHAGSKAQKLDRRVFAVDVEQQRVLEWSTEVDSWQMLAGSEAIADIAFVTPLPIKALVSASTADDAMAEALIAKRNPAFASKLAASRSDGRVEGKREGRLEGLAQSILLILKSRGLPVSGHAEQRIVGCRDLETIERWVSAAATATSIDEMFH